MFLAEDWFSPDANEEQSTTNDISSPHDKTVGDSYPEGRCVTQGLSLACTRIAA